MTNSFDRFPRVLREALESGKIEFPKNTQWKYEDRKAYRGVRITDKKTTIDKTDFKSQVESDEMDSEDLSEYSCSCFENMQDLKIAFHLPRKNKGIAEGFVKKECGPIVLSDKDSHINWFLFENADPSKEFQIIERDEDE